MVFTATPTHRGKQPHDNNAQKNTSRIVYLDGAVHRAGEEASSLYSQTRDATVMSDQSLGTSHVLHVPYLQGGVVSLYHYITSDDSL